MLHSTTLSVWQKNQRGWIQRDSFVNQFQAILDRRKRQIVRERAETLFR